VAWLPRPVAKRLRAVKNSLTKHWVDESEIIAGLAPDARRRGGAVLVDVGAHEGSVTFAFLEKGWSVIAYEPDPSNRAYLEKRLRASDRVQLSPCAVSDQAMESVALFSSPTASGISTLSAFHESHTPTTTVKVVTLAEDLRARSVERVDFLKIDIEGYDFFALKGFDWSYTPRFVLYEFEDRKTVRLGYSLADSVAFIAGLGYHVVYSVWEPIIEYGIKHRWRGLFSTPPADIDKCWGNVLAFRDPADAAACIER
jgi:FkbM family methyltransferase